MAIYYCKYCGHALFKIIKMNKFKCVRCLKLICSMDDLEPEKSEELKMSKDQIVTDALLYHTRIVGRINLVKKKIDEALDKGDKESFYTYSKELKHLENMLESSKA